MHEPGAPLIQLQGIRKVFVTDDVETHAIAGVSLAVSAGEFLTIAGPSGCGKSTLLSILGLLDDVTGGTYHLDGRSVGELSAHQRARLRSTHVGFVFQSFNLLGDLTVGENVELPLVYAGVSAHDRRARVARALEQVGMSHRTAHFPAQLSGGQQQRVAVARAIVGEPLVILADEPTGNLDSVNAESVMQLLAELNAAGSTICMVTHDPRYAGFAKRTVRMLDGRILDGAEAVSPDAPDLAARPAGGSHPTVAR